MLARGIFGAGVAVARIRKADQPHGQALCSDGGAEQLGSLRHHIRRNVSRSAAVEGHGPEYRIESFQKQESSSSSSRLFFLLITPCSPPPVLQSLHHNWHHPLLFPLLLKSHHLPHQSPRFGHRTLPRRSPTTTIIVTFCVILSPASGPCVSKLPPIHGTRQDVREADDEEGDEEGGREEGACCAGAGVKVVHCLFFLSLSPSLAWRNCGVMW